MTAFLSHWRDLVGLVAAILAIASFAIGAAHADEKRSHE